MAQPVLDEVAAGDAQGDELEDGAVAGGHFRQGGAADEQGDFAAGDVVAGDEVEDAVLFLDIDAVALQHAAGGGEELRRRDGFHQAQGDEIGLALQVWIDGE